MSEIKNEHEACDEEIKTLQDENESLKEQIDGLEEILRDIRNLVR